MYTPPPFFLLYPTSYGMLLLWLLIGVRGGVCCGAVCVAARAAHVPTILHSFGCMELESVSDVSLAVCCPFVLPVVVDV